MRYLIFCFLILLQFLCSGNYAQNLPFAAPFSNSVFEKNKIIDFSQDENNVLYLLNSKDLYTFNGQKISRVLAFNDSSDTHIRHSHFQDGLLFTASSQGLQSFHLADHTVTKLYDQAVDEFYVSPNLEIYIKQDGKLGLLTDGTVENLIGGLQDQGALYFHKKYKYVTNSQGYGLNRYQVLATDADTRGLFPNQKVSAFYGGKEFIMVAIAGTIYRVNEDFEAEKIVTIGLDNIRQIYEDNTGNLWLISSLNKLYFYDGIQQMQLSMQNAYNLLHTNKIKTLRDGNLWFGGNKLTYFNVYDPLLTYSKGKQLQGEDLLDIMQADEDKYLVFAKPNHLHKISFESMSYEYSIGALKNEAINALSIIDRQNFIYTNRQNEIRLYSNGSIRVLYRGNKLSTLKSNQHLISCLDTNGNLLIYNKKDGKLNIHQTDFIEYSLKDDNEVLAQNKDLSIVSYKLADKRSSAVAIAHKQVDHLYGTQGLVLVLIDQQLYSVENKQLVAHKHEAFNNKPVYHLLLETDKIWFDNGEGLFAMEINIQNNQFNVQNTQNLGRGSLAFNNTLLKALKSKDGLWYLLTKDELILYNPFKNTPNLQSPGLLIERVSIISRDSATIVPQDYSGKYIVNLRDEIEITAHPVNFVENTKVDVVYSLDEESAWRTVPQGERINIRNLKRGDHFIIVRSRNEEGIYSANSYRLDVKIKPPFWSSAWFIATVLLSLIAIGLVSYKAATTVKDNRAKEMQEMLDRELLKLERQSHEQMLKAEKLKQLNDLITAQKDELENKNRQIEGQKYELALTNEQIKKQKDVIQETGNKLQSSINYAMRIQTALMPDNKIIKEKIPESFIYFKPRDYVSGDFYWFKAYKNEVGEEEFLIAAVDCTGHGVPGAIVSVVGINLLDVIVTHKKIYDPGAILTEMNKDLRIALHHEKTDINDGMDMSILRINKQQNIVHFAGAKNPLYYIEGNDMERIRGDKYPIGGQQREEERIFQTHEIPLTYGEPRMFYLFSDGYQDQFGGDEKFKFLTKNFREMLIEINQFSMEEQYRELERRLIEWKGEVPQTDDILVIGLKL